MKRLSNKMIISNIDKDLEISSRFMFIVLIDEGHWLLRAKILNVIKLNELIRIIIKSSHIINCDD